MKTRFLISMFSLLLLISLIAISIPIFAEIMPSTSPISISTPYNSYVSGDKVFVRVVANPNSNVTISMMDPSKNTVTNIVEATDEEGHISTSFILPFYAEYGTWILNATDGINSDTVQFDVVALQKERMIHDIMTLERYKPIGDLFGKSDHVLVGTIMQIENITENTLRYSIDVDFYLKDEQSFDFITVVSDNIQKPTDNIPAVNAILSLNSPSFIEGDLVFVYLKNINGQHKVLPQSFVIEKDGWYLVPGIVHTDPTEKDYEKGDEILFSGMVQKSELYQSVRKDKPFDLTLTVYDEHGMDVLSEPLEIDVNATYQYKLQTANLPMGKYEYKIDFSGGKSGQSWNNEFTINPTAENMSPLKQLKYGIEPWNVKCNDGLTLLLTPTKNNPACVTGDTANKLIERHWSLVVSRGN